MEQICGSRFFQRVPQGTAQQTEYLRTIVSCTFTSLQTVKTCVLLEEKEVDLICCETTRRVMCKNKEGDLGMTQFALSLCERIWGHRNRQKSVQLTGKFE